MTPPAIASLARHALLILASGGLAWVLYPDLAHGPWRASLLGYEILLEAPTALLGALALPWFLLLHLEASGWPVRRSTVGVIALRVLCWGALVLSLCQPQWMSAAKPASIVLLVDESRSIGEADQQQAKQFIDHIMAMSVERDVHLVSFAHAPHLVDHLQRAPRTTANEATDIARALNLAMTLPVTSETRRVVLLSDGLATQGDTLAAAAQAQELGVPIDTVPLDSPPPPEVALTAFSLPDQVQLGHRFSAQATIESNRAAKGTLRLFRQARGKETLEATRTLKLGVGEMTVAFSEMARELGLLHYRVELEVQEGDQIPENNRASADTFVRGPAVVLALDNGPIHLSAFAAALEAAGYHADLRSPAGMSSRPSELDQFQAIVVSNISGTDLNSAQIDALSHYVREGGCLLWSLGDETPADRDANAALSRLLPVTPRGTESEEEASAALALLIDASGSMAGEKLDLAKAAVVAAVELLHDEDLIEVIGFAGSPERVVHLQRAAARRQIVADIQRLLPHGGTALLPAMDLAYQDLSGTNAVLKHTVLLTDGQTDESGLATLAHLFRGEGITLSTVGLGEDVNRELLASLANLTGGRAHFTNDPNAVPRIFMQETSRVRHSSIHEGRFRIQKTSAANFLLDVPLNSAPALRGHSVVKSSSAAEVVLTNDDGHPLLVRRRWGQGWVLVWTSDFAARWSADLLRWPRFADFVARLIGEHQRHDDLQRLQLQIAHVGHQWLVSADVMGLDGTSLNGLSGTVELKSTTYATRQVGPGRYEARVPSEAASGSAAIIARFRAGDQIVAQGHASARRPYAPELIPQEADVELLRLLSATSGGLFRASANSLLTATPKSMPRQGRPLRLPLLAAALALFLLELVARTRLRTAHLS